MARLLPPNPLRLLWYQRHLRRDLDAHALVVVEHLGGGDAASFEDDLGHLRHFRLRGFLEAGGIEHGWELVDGVGTVVSNFLRRR
jgi:hypothetical protein